MKREELEEIIDKENDERERELAYHAKDVINKIIRNQAEIKRLEAVNTELRAELVKLEVEHVDLKEVLG